MAGSVVRNRPRLSTTDPRWLVVHPIVDRLVILYLAGTSVIFWWNGVPAVGHRIIFGIHWLAIGGIVVLRRWLSGQPPERRSGMRKIHAFYPIASLPLLYKELAVLNRIVTDRYYDPVVRRWEQWLFPSAPVMRLSQWIDHPLLSEFFHFSYISYYWMIIALSLALYCTRQYRQYQVYVFTLLLTFYFCYLWFIFFPVEGPRYSVTPLAPALRQGPFYRLSHWILAQGAARGTAFPSSHVAAGVVTLLCAWTMAPRWFWTMLPFAVGLVVGTVYGRFHYAVDATAGLGVAFLFRWIGPALYRRMVNGGGMPARR